MLLNMAILFGLLGGFGVTPEFALAQSPVDASPRASIERSLEIVRTYSAPNDRHHRFQRRVTRAALSLLASGALTGLSAVGIEYSLNQTWTSGHAPFRVYAVPSLAFLSAAAGLGFGLDSLIKIGVTGADLIALLKQATIERRRRELVELLNLPIDEQLAALRNDPDRAEFIVTLAEDIVRGRR